MSPPTTHISSSHLDALTSLHSILTAFKSFDSDSDGLITIDELKAIIESLAFCSSGDRKAAEMMREGDANGDGMLTAEELVAVMAGELELGEVADVLKAAFPVIDGAGEEEVTGEELYDVLSCMGSVVISMDDCMDIIASMDGDGDGAVSMDDLKMIVGALSYT